MCSRAGYGALRGPSFGSCGWQQQQQQRYCGSAARHPPSQGPMWLTQGIPVKNESAARTSEMCPAVPRYGRLANTYCTAVARVILVLDQADKASSGIDLGQIYLASLFIKSGINRCCTVKSWSMLPMASTKFSTMLPGTELTVAIAAVGFLESAFETS